MRRPLATTALAAALITACGDDDETGRTATVEGGGRIEVVGREYSFDPRRIIYEGGAARAKITISLDNRGSLAHNLKVFAGDRELGGTPSFQGGREDSGSVQLAPGEYRMVCTVGNHEQLGMRGTLVVR